MLSGAWRIGSVRGIDIRIHSSWILIALLVAWSFFGRFAPDDRFGVASGAVMAVVAAILFFASVLVHELAHSLEARHRGVEVGGITLFLFGGVTETRFDVRRPRDEFALTAVGPFASFVLAALFGIVATYARDLPAPAVAAVSGSLAWVNAALGLFNLLPGAPLDGGRILRSAIWWITGDRPKAVTIAARSGQVLGGSLAIYGLFQLFASPTGLVNGLWLALIGWFLYSAAKQELDQQRARDALEGRPVRDLVEDTPRGLSEHATVADAADALTRSPLDIVALHRDGQVVAIVRVEDVAAVAQRDRDRPASTIATPVSELAAVSADDDVMDVLERLRSADVVAVRDHDNEVVSVATTRHLVRALERASELHRRGWQRGSTSAHLPPSRHGDHLPGEHPS